MWHTTQLPLRMTMPFQLMRMPLPFGMKTLLFRLRMKMPLLANLGMNRAPLGRVIPAAINRRDRSIPAPI
jgi:hypothetical protein